MPLAKSIVEIGHKGSLAVSSEGVGKGTTVKRAILDKNTRIGSGVSIINKDNVEEADRSDQGFYIRNGIVVVQKNATIADGTVI